MALGDESGHGGIPEDPKTGQPELLPARHPACGYAWPVPFGLQLKAEALLLQAAQQLGRRELTAEERSEWVAGVEEQGTSDEPPETASTKVNSDKSGGSFRSTPATLSPQSLIQQAQTLLHESLNLWQPLHDPEPEHPNQNFKLNG